VLTGVDQDVLRDLDYLCVVEELIRLRAGQSIACGCDGIIARPKIIRTGSAALWGPRACWS
jgi:hypothetical protein